MAEWVTIPSFATDDVVRAATFQDMLTNLDILKDPPYAETDNPNLGAVAWTFTGGSAFFDIDDVYYRIAFESWGHPILIMAQVRASHSLANGAVGFRFLLDSVVVGNGTDPRTSIIRDNYNLQTTYITTHFVPVLTAGNHEIVMQALAATTGEVWGDCRLWLAVWEF